MENWVAELVSLATAAGGRILLALAALIAGSFIIKRLLKLLGKSKSLAKLDPSVRGFTLSFAKIVLYVVLAVSVISILGVPMASVVTVLASAGVAVGLALQGALSNLAGGLMLMIFKPFKVGDYVDAAGVEGTVQEITMFYTVFMTLDNKRVTVPNGSLMNANVVNFSSEPLRRVDLVFSCAKSEAPAQIQQLLRQVVEADPRALKEPAPFARLSGGDSQALEFTVRAWCKNADYWDLYYDLTQAVTEAFAEAGVKAPALRVLSE